MPRERAGSRGCRHPGVGAPRPAHDGGVGGGRGEARGVPGAGPKMGAAGHAGRVGGPADATYPLQKKGHTQEFLRTIAHLRPRSNLYGAIFRVRTGWPSRCTTSSRSATSSMCTRRSSPPATARGRARCSVSPARPQAAQHRGQADGPGFLRTDLPDRQRPARGRDFRLRALQHLHLRPDLPRRELNTARHAAGILDDRAGDGLL